MDGVYSMTEERFRELCIEYERAKEIMNKIKCLHELEHKIIEGEAVSIVVHGKEVTTVDNYALVMQEHDWIDEIKSFMIDLVHKRIDECTEDFKQL